MKKIFFSICLIFSLSNVATAAGIFYSDVTKPMLATGADASQLRKYKRGEAVSKSYCYLIEKGDSGIRRAALNGGITKIHFIDVKEKNIFFIYKEKTTVVYGE